MGPRKRFGDFAQVVHRPQMEARRPIPKPHGAQTGPGCHCPPTTPLPDFSRPDSDDSGFSTQREAANGGLVRGREGRLLQPLTRLERRPARPRPSRPLFRASACRGEPGPQGAHPGASATGGWLGKPTAGASVLMEPPPDHRWSPRSAQEGQPQLTQAPSRGQSPREGPSPSSSPGSQARSPRGPSPPSLHRAP